MTRNNVTAASRIMLPVYVIAFCWIGLGWMLDNPHQLTEAPALRYADQLLPIDWWGALLTAAGLLIAGALASHNRTLCRYALWVAAIAMSVFVLVFAGAALFADASPGAPAWPFLTAAACIASEQSLLKGERD